MSHSEAWTSELADLRAGLKQGLACSQTERPGLTDALEAFACGGPLPDPAWAALLATARERDESGLRREAGRLLVHLGRWDGHDDPALLAGSILRPWSPELEAEVVQQPDLPQGILVWPGAWTSIDSEDPEEVDDALWAEREGDDIVLRVAIASPVCFLPEGCRIDREARERAATFYHPRYTAPMLPPRLGADLASLNLGQQRPSLVFEVVLDPAGVMRLRSVREAMIAVVAALSYTEAQAALDGTATALDAPTVAHLRLLAEAALRSESHRISRGAWLLYRPDLEIDAPRHAPIVLRQADQSSLARRVVGEAMVLCGLAAADFGRSHGIAMPYRTQSAPRQPPLPPGLYTVPADIYAMLRHMSPAHFASRAGPHAVLGAEAYVQASSPLRRYGDLAAHRQILGVLRGGRPPLSATGLRRLMEHGAGLMRRYRAIDRQARRRFTLAALAAQGLGQRMRAQLVDDPARKGRTLAFVPRYALEVELRGYAGDPGTWLELEATGVDLQALALEVEVRGRIG